MKAASGADNARAVWPRSGGDAHVHGVGLRLGLLADGALPGDRGPRQRLLGGRRADGALPPPRSLPTPLQAAPRASHPALRPCAHASPHAGLARRRRAPASPLHHPGSLAPPTRPCAHAGHKAGLRSVRGGGPARGLACRMQAQRGQRGLHGPLCARGARPRSRHVGGDGLTLPHPALFRPALPSPQSVKHCSSKPCSSKPCSSGRS